MIDLFPFPYILEMRLFVFAGLVLIFGILLGWMVAIVGCHRRYKLSRQTKQRLASLEEEIAALRAAQQHATATPLIKKSFNE